MAKHNLEEMLRHCAVPPSGGQPENDDLAAVRKKSFHDVTHELVRQVRAESFTSVAC